MSTTRSITPAERTELDQSITTYQPHTSFFGEKHTKPEKNRSGFDNGDSSTLEAAPGSSKKLV